MFACVILPLSRFSFGCPKRSNTVGKEGYRPGSRKILLACQPLCIQVHSVYDADLQTPQLDDFSFSSSVAGLLPRVILCISCQVVFSGTASQSHVPHGVSGSWFDRQALYPPQPPATGSIILFPGRSPAGPHQETWHAVSSGGRSPSPTTAGVLDLIGASIHRCSPVQNSRFPLGQTHHRSLYHYGTMCRV